MNTCSNLLILKCIRPKYFASCKCIRCTLWRCATRVVWSSDVRSLKIDNLAKRVKSKVSILSRSCCTLAQCFHFALSVALKLLAKYIIFCKALNLTTWQRKLKVKLVFWVGVAALWHNLFILPSQQRWNHWPNIFFFRKALNLTTWQS